MATSQAQIRRVSRAGFTFIEVLVALVILVTVVTAMMDLFSGLLKAQARTAHYREAWLELGTLSTAAQLGISNDDVELMTPNAWFLESRQERVPGYEGDVDYTAWTLAPADAPALVFMFGHHL